jgi:hypothetical protein
MKQTALIKLVRALPLICLSTLFLSAQSGGTYEITQSVIANGGGKSADAIYLVEGTFAQPAAGTVSTLPPYTFQAGFWQSFFIPTAASVSISGRVVTTTGRLVQGGRVLLTSSQGDAARTAYTNTFGSYRIDGIEAGQSYMVNVVTKGLRFEPRVVTILDEITDLDLIVFE